MDWLRKTQGILGGLNSKNEKSYSENFFVPVETPDQKSYRATKSFKSKIKNMPCLGSLRPPTTPKILNLASTNNHHRLVELDVGYGPLSVATTILRYHRSSLYLRLYHLYLSSLSLLPAVVAVQAVGTPCQKPSEQKQESPNKGSGTWVQKTSPRWG